MSTNRPPITLYGYYRSSSSHRVQIGLRLKQLEFTYHSISLDALEQETPAFRAINPGGQIPVLVIGDNVFTHAFAMLELLEELFPDAGTPLLPADPVSRARAREIAQCIACLMQPMMLPRSIRLRMIDAFHLNDHPDGAQAACATFIKAQLNAMLPELNRLVARTAGTYAVGDQPTIADCAIIPQLVSSAKAGIDLNAFHALSKVYEACSRHPAFQAAHPDALPDAPKPGDTPAPAAAAAAPSDTTPTLLESTMAYKEADAFTSRYITQHNRPVPQMEFVRDEAMRLFGPVATKISARDICFFLRWLTGLLQPRCIIEIGVFTGSSSLALLEAMPTDGKLIAFDVSEEYTAIARAAWQQAGFADRVDLRLQDAAIGLKELAHDPTVAGQVDLAYIDGLNTQYQENYRDLLPLLKIGGIILFDNVLWKGRVARPQPNDDAQTIHLRELNQLLRDDPRIDPCIIALGDGLALARKR
jgi:maleylacetoacetate isomerase